MDMDPLGDDIAIASDIVSWVRFGTIRRREFGCLTFIGYILTRRRWPGFGGAGTFNWPLKSRCFGTEV